MVGLRDERSLTCRSQHSREHHRWTGREPRPKSSLLVRRFGAFQGVPLPLALPHRGLRHDLWCRSVAVPQPRRWTQDNTDTTSFREGCLTSNTHVLIFPHLDRQQSSRAPPWRRQTSHSTSFNSSRRASSFDFTHFTSTPLLSCRRTCPLRCTETFKSVRHWVRVRLWRKSRWWRDADPFCGRSHAEEKQSFWTNVDCDEQRLCSRL